MAKSRKEIFDEGYFQKNPLHIMPIIARDIVSTELGGANAASVKNVSTPNFFTPVRVFSYALDQELSSAFYADIDIAREIRANPAESYFSQERHNNWCVFVKNSPVDLDKSCSLTEDFYRAKGEFRDFQGVLDKFSEAVQYYKEQCENLVNVKKLSEASALNFLFLVPVLFKYKLQIAVDADTGYLTTTLHAADGVLTALITDKSEIHFSLVGQGARIFKISGTAKIKDNQDLTKFNRILMML